MKKLRCEGISSLFLGAVLYLGCLLPVEAQNVQCADRPAADSSNACANTRFVQNHPASLVVGTTPISSGTSMGVLYDNAGFLGNTAAGAAESVFTGNGATAPTFKTASTWFDSAYCNTIGYLIVRTTSVWTCSQGIPANPVWWGADATGASTSTAAVNSALAAANFIQFPPGTFKLDTAPTGLTTAKKILGSGRFVTTINVNFATGNVFSFTGSAAGSEVGYLSWSAGVTRTSGSYIFGDTIRLNVHDQYMDGPYIGVTYTQNTTLSLADNVECRNITPHATSAGSSCFVLGAVGGGANPDTVVLRRIIAADDTPATPARACITIFSSVAAVIDSAQCLQGQVGLLAQAGNGDGILSTNIVGKSHFDSTTVAGQYWATSGTGNIARVNQFGSWASGSGGHGIQLDYSGSGTATGFNCIGCQLSLNTFGSGLLISSAGWSDVNVGGGSCIAQNLTGITVPAAFTKFSLKGSLVGTCDGLTGNTTGLLLGGTTSNNVHIVGNNFTGSTTPITITSAFTGADNSIFDNINYPGYTGVGDTAYTITTIDNIVATDAAFTTARTWTLPAAANYRTGRPLRVYDAQGTLTSTNTLTLARAGADTIDGATSLVLNSAYAGVNLVSDGVSKWSVWRIGVSQGGTGISSGTSGGIPYFNSTTSLASSALLGSGLLMTGGGAGAAPATITLGGDCTFATPNITCTKTNGTNFGTAATQNTGTSGANLPFLNGNNTWSGTNAFGLIGINTTANSNIAATIGGTITGTGAFGIYMGGLTLTPGNGNSAYFQYAGGGVVATGGTTVAGAYGALIAPYTKGGGGTITNAYGLFADTQTVGTNNWSIWSAGDVNFQAQTYVPNAASDSGGVDNTACIRTSNGQLLKGSGASGICLGSSSMRFKTPLGEVTQGLDTIEHLKPVRFSPKSGEYGDVQRVHYGFYAEDIARVLPDLAGKDDQGRPINYDWPGLIPVMVKAMQELKASNDNLKAEIVKLKRRASR